MREPRIFILQDQEQQAADDWRDRHPCRPGAQQSADRADFSYTFTPGGIGTVIVIRCLLCEQEENVTDFSCW